MLKSPLTICLCSSFFLLPAPFAKGKAELLSSSAKPMEGRARTVSLKAPAVPLNKQGMQFVRTYIKKSHRNLRLIKHRSETPFSIIDSVFKCYDLPLELKYLAVIESELNPSATSHVGASGPWQFMPETAEILGLKISSRRDERRNYYKSTRAAARYLKDLYSEFGDWLLVIAAYNVGPGPVLTAIDKSGSRNFWILQRYLPLETRLHVKKFIATQYYFEGQGSLTTLTKAETARYKKKLKNLVVAGPENRPRQQVSMSSGKRESVVFAEQAPTPFLAQITGRWMFETPGISSMQKAVINESSEEKFQRLMKESEALLHKSGELLGEIK